MPIPEGWLSIYLRITAKTHQNPMVRKTTKKRKDKRKKKREEQQKNQMR